MRARSWPDRDRGCEGNERFSGDWRFQSSARAATAVHAESELLRSASRRNYSRAHDAQGSGIAGRHPGIALDGWTPEQMIIKRSAGMTLNWPSITTKGEFDLQTFTFKPKAFKIVKKEGKRRSKRSRATSRRSRLQKPVRLARRYQIAATGSRFEAKR